MVGKVLNKAVVTFLNPIQDGGKGGSPVTSTNVGIRPQNVMAFNSNPFSTLVYNFKFVPSANP